MQNPKQIKSQIDNWDRRIADLRTKRNSVGDRSRPEYDRQLDLMASKLEIMKDSLSKQANSEGEAREDLDTIIQKSLKEVDNAFNSAISKLM